MTPRDDEKERLSRALREGATSRSAPPEAGKTPGIESEKIWAAVRGELPAAEMRELLDRTVDDPELALEWQLAREMQAEMAAEGREGSVAPIHGRTASRWRGLGLVAASLLVAVVATLTLRTGPEPVYRDPGGAAIESLLPAEAEFSSKAPVLRWSGPPEGRYEVSVLREGDLREVFQAADLTVDSNGDGAIEVPPSVLAALSSDEVLLWRVEAVLPDGERLQSQTFRVRWRPDPLEAPPPSSPAPNE